MGLPLRRAAGPPACAAPVATASTARAGPGQGDQVRGDGRQRECCRPGTRVVRLDREAHDGRADGRGPAPGRQDDRRRDAGGREGPPQDDRPRGHVARASMPEPAASASTGSRDDRLIHPSRRDLPGLGVCRSLQEAQRHGREANREEEE